MHVYIKKCTFYTTLINDFIFLKFNLLSVLRPNKAHSYLKTETALIKNKLNHESSQVFLLASLFKKHNEPNG